MAAFIGTVNNVGWQPALPVGLDLREPLIPRSMKPPKLPAGDVLRLGVSDKPDTSESIRIVNERAMDKLRQVVAQARTELGLSEDVRPDLSPEATGDRIADFALKWFGQWAKNNQAGDTEEDRARFVEFIGKAVQKDVEEARGILNALNALNPEVNRMISQTVERVQARFEDFIRNGMASQSDQG